MTLNNLSRRSALAALCALLPLSAHAAFDPASGTIDENNATISAQTPAPRAGANPTPQAEPLCNDGVDCDTFELTLDLSDAFRASNPNTSVKFEVSWDQVSPQDDVDVYVRDPDGNIVGQSATGDNPEIVVVPISDIASTATLEALWFSLSGNTINLDIELISTGEGADAIDLCAPDGEDTESGELVIDPAVAQDFSFLGESAFYGAFIQFNSGTHKQQDALIASLPLEVKGDFRKYAKSVFVQGPVSAFFDLMDSPMVSRIEHNYPIRYFGDTQPWATKVRVVQEEVAGGPYRDSQGRLLTGQGLTLGVIDSGLYGAHPDYDINLLHNFKLTNFLVNGIPRYADVGKQDSENGAGGHGTHVTGTVGGGGLYSRYDYPVPEVAPNIPGTYTGAAPDARIIHWAHGAGLLVLSAVTAYEHILDIEDTFEPRMVAVNNSYGADPGPHDPASTATCLINEIVEERGIVMAFAAGNDGGDGTSTATSPACKNPVPGVICVASQNDQNSGDPNAPLSGFSSRGLQDDPLDHPDIAAPGDTITSTCFQPSATQAICVGGEGGPAETQWLPWHGTISGTSMATPHITGIIGLIKQADPSLTPGEIELLIQRTARKVGGNYVPDPQQPDGGTTNFEWGAGLVDMQAIAIEMGLRGTALPDVSEEWVIFDQDIDGPGDATDVVSMTMQNENIDGVTGITHRLTLADASSGDAVYTISRNVHGLPFATVATLSGGVAAVGEPGPGNNSIAQSVSLDGNVLSVFVPFLQMGAPEINSPVHNIQVTVEDASGITDIAPSADNNPDNPVYGRAFTTQLAPGVLPPSDEKTCELPGLTYATSPFGVNGTALGTGQDDILQAWVAEPTELPDTVAFTIKVASSLDPSPPPNYRWAAYFNVPGDDNDYFVGMDTSAGAPLYVYGTRGSQDAGGVTSAGTFTTLGNLNAASGFAGDTVTLVIDKAELGITTGMELTGLFAATRQNSNPANGAGLRGDEAGGSGPYQVVGNDVCASPTGVTGVVEAAPAAADAVSRSGGGSLGSGLLVLLLLGGLARRRLH